MLDIYHNGEMYTRKKEADKKLRQLEAERDALQAAILEFKENPITRNKFKLFDLIEGKGDE